VKQAIITLKKNKKAFVVAQSLHPETARTIPRTQVDIKEIADKILISVQASDVSALRAALNSYLRWMKVSEDTYLETELKGS
jgi:KEOPS complex subunit Pcc1